MLFAISYNPILYILFIAIRNCFLLSLSYKISFCILHNATFRFVFSIRFIAYRNISRRHFLYIAFRNHFPYLFYKSEIIILRNTIILYNPSTKSNSLYCVMQRNKLKKRLQFVSVFYQYIHCINAL